MYAKLFSRITESSLMEEPIPTRYVFVMLLAIANPTGHVIGTDVALARRLNMPMDEFMPCLETLLAPDPNSNSLEHDGRRLLPSEGERGYLIVNYLAYRAIRDENDRRAYMKEYMKKYRESRSVSRSRSRAVNSRKQCKPPLSQEEEELRVNHAPKSGESAPLSPEPIHPTNCDCAVCGNREVIPSKR